jgi:hypothetical protein
VRSTTYEVPYYVIFLHSPIIFSIQWVSGAFSLGVKRPRREAYHSPPSSAEVKEWVQLYLRSCNTPSWRGGQLNHRDNFTFHLTFYPVLIHNLCFSFTVKDKVQLPCKNKFVFFFVYFNLSDLRRRRENRNALLEKKKSYRKWRAIKVILMEGKGKVVPALNLAPRHEDVLGSGGIAPRILWPRH